MMGRPILAKLLYSLIGLLFSSGMLGADINGSSNLSVDDRKVFSLKGNVSEMIYPDGTSVRFDETGKLICYGNTQYSYQEKMKYVLEHGVVMASNIISSGNVRTEISEDTGKKTEEYVFDEKGRLQEHVVHYPLFRKHQYFYQGSDINPFKEVYQCDTIPSGALSFYYVYLKTDKEGNWLQRSVKVSGGEDITGNRLYIASRRLKYHLIPENTVSTDKDVKLKLNIYESNLLNLNKTDRQNALKRGSKNFVLVAPQNVEIGEEFEIAYEMKEKPRDAQISKSKQFEFLYYDFRVNTVASGGDTLKLYQLMLRLKAKQKGKLILPTLKARIGGKLNISPSREMMAMEAYHVPSVKSDTCVITLSATLNKDTIRTGESAVLSLRICTTYREVAPTCLSLPEIPSCAVQELVLDSIAWKKIPFEKGLYYIGEYKRYKLTPATAGVVEILPVKLDCVLKRFTFPDADLLRNISRPSTLLGLGVAVINTAAALRSKIDKRNETVHTDLLHLHVLP